MLVIMPHVHRMLSKDLQAMTGVCRNCGPVQLAKRSGGYACAKARRSDPTRASRNGEAFKRKYGNASRGPHGLTSAEVKERTEGKECEICGANERIFVDHCHATSLLRGVLCSDCNVVLGFVKDSPQRLRAAASYLEKYATGA